MTKDVAILVPMLGRPHNVKLVADSLEASTKSYRLLFIVSVGDVEVVDEVNKHGYEYILMPPVSYGDYAVKINAAFNYVDEELIFTGAGDLTFHDGWFEEATSKLSSDIHVVGTNDLANYKVLAGKHSTHSLVTREYVDKYGTIDTPGKVLCEQYWHEYVDDEFIETAKFRNAFAMAMDSIVEHRHPIANKAAWDVIYKRTEERMKIGKQIYRARRHLWT